MGGAMFACAAARAGIVACLATAAFFSGCSRKQSESQAAKEGEASAAYSANGWTGGERAEYYHLPEGSELMPYTLLANLESVKTGKPFLQNMERFGFLPDAVSSSNPHGLPVGITTVRSRDTSITGIEMVGFNCAACHVGELTYRGKRLRIDGAPALINLQGYQIEFKDSLDATLKNPRKLLALVMAMDRASNATDTPSSGEIDRYASDPAVKTAGDVRAVSTADPKFHSMSSKDADAARPPAAQPGFTARLKKNVAFLKARLAYIKNGRLIVDGTEPGPGRVDAFGAARNFLFPQHAVKMQAPVSFPFVWNVPDTTQQRAGGDDMRWIHYDGNTNSILERNIGQALGMGAVFDPKTYASTLRIGNLHRLEVLTHQLQPPSWPADMFGPVDEAKAAEGREIFQTMCADCHQNRLFTADEMGTDRNRAASFGRPVGGKPFPDAVAPILSRLKLRAFQDDGIGAKEQLAMDANPVVWRDTGKYMARPLAGIWATAPYLHNGSVPSVHALLHPEARAAKFAVGNREYDPEKLGYRTEPPSDGVNSWTLDTAAPGNSNGGHAGERFGTLLPEDRKAALLEYLKTL